MGPLITTELESAIIALRNYEPSPIGWTGRRHDAVVAQERELTERESDRVLGVICDVARDFLRIELGLV